MVLAVSATLLSALVGSLNGYVLAKWPFRGSGLLFALILFGMFIPYQSILIPLFQFMKSIGLYGSLFGLVLVHVIYGIPIVTLIFRNYYSEIPDELVEAARIDGAGFFGIFRHVILPLSVPAFVVVAIWQFTQIWNEFLFAVTLTRPESQPITVALAQLAGGGGEVEPAHGRGHPGGPSHPPRLHPPRPLLPPGPPRGLGEGVGPSPFSRPPP